MQLEQTRHAWDKFAEPYDEHMTPWTTKGAEEALRMARVQPGDRLLDIASGGGALSIPAATMGAEVLAVDYSTAMVELLRRKARRLGLSQLQVRRMDGTALELESGSFDFACSSLGIMLFPDRRSGMREMVRVLRGGGKGVIVALAAAPRVLPISLFVSALANTLADFTPPEDSPLYSLADLRVLGEELREAGMTAVEVREFESEVEVRSADHLWLMITSGAPAIAGLMHHLSEAERSDVRLELSRLLASWSDAGGVVRLPLTFNLGVGTKPSR